MISIVAADKEGLKASRLRNYHLRGSSAINYEADIILILNEKYQIVAKVNIEFNPYQAQRFRDWVVVSVEKNRGGQNNVDLEFEKHFEFSCFDPNGRTGAGEAHRGAPLQRLSGAPLRGTPAALPLRSSLTQLADCARSGRSTSALPRHVRWPSPTHARRSAARRRRVACGSCTSRSRSCASFAGCLDSGLAQPRLMPAQRASHAGAMPAVARAARRCEVDKERVDRS